MGAAQDPGVKKICVVEERSLTRGLLFALCAPMAHVSFARHGRALAGESPEHAQVVGDV